jgi:putative addiction module CopG family antidote
MRPADASRGKAARGMTFAPALRLDSVVTDGNRCPTMNVALTTHWEGFIRQLIESGRYNNASEVVRAALRQLQEIEGESFPAGSLKHLYTKSANEEESQLARRLRVPAPTEV